VPSARTESEGPRRRLSAADRREAILEAALQAFSEQGFDGASLDDVAAGNGISKALIYEHFASKRELQMALLDRFVSDLLGNIVSAIAHAEPHEDRLKSGLEALLEFAEERPGAWRLLSRNVSDPVVAETLERLREQTAETIAAIMVEDAAERQEGDLPVEQTAAVFAHLLSGGIQFLVGWWIENPGSLSREQIVDQVMNFAWIGLERLTAGERWRP
jgi:AcrR family transcriptional regulator